MSKKKLRRIEDFIRPRTFFLYRYNRHKYSYKFSYNCKFSLHSQAQIRDLCVQRGKSIYYKNCACKNIPKLLNTHTNLHCPFFAHTNLHTSTCKSTHKSPICACNTSTGTNLLTNRRFVLVFAFTNRRFVRRFVFAGCRLPRRGKEGAKKGFARTCNKRRFVLVKVQKFRCIQKLRSIRKVLAPCNQERLKIFFYDISRPFNFTEIFECTHKHKSSLPFLSPHKSEHKSPICACACVASTNQKFVCRFARACEGTKVLVYSNSKTNYTVVRPLINCSRRFITMSCILSKLPVYPDVSNLKVRYSRNRIRKQIIPSLQLFFNPKVEKNLFKFSEFYNRHISSKKRCL